MEARPPIASAGSNASGELSDSFDCFGGRCGVWVAGDGLAHTAPEAVAMVRRVLGRWHQEFTRFDPESQLSALNRDPRTTVPVTSLMARFADAAVDAAYMSNGLVDATLLGELERAGYDSHHEQSIGLEEMLRMAPDRAAARPHPGRRWEAIKVDRSVPSITRPPGLSLDGGGIAKGLFADILGDVLASNATYLIDCGGDLRLGGRATRSRPIDVLSPFDEKLIHRYELSEGGVATSGIGRSWLGADGLPAHHLLDPSIGRPAYSGVVQATALAPTALEAEVRAKCAALAGPDAAEHWLVHGGVVVHDDASVRVIQTPRTGGC